MGYNSFMKLTGITIFTQNIVALTNFYKDLLYTNPTETSDMSSLITVNEFRYFIHKKHEPRPDLPPSEDHFEFEVENVELLTKELQGKGLKVEFFKRV